MKKIALAQVTFLLLQIGLSVPLTSCEKTGLGTSSNSLSRPVVEAYLQPGQLPTVKITRQAAFENSDSLATPVEGLTVTIESGGEVRSVHYDVSGVYAGDGTWQPVAGKTYHLAFTDNSKTITAETSIPLKPANFKVSATTIAIPKIGDPGSGGSFPTFPDPLKLTWDNDDNSYYLMVAENLETNPEAIFDDNGGDRPRPNFRSSPAQTNTYEIGFQSFEYYGKHRVILYRLNAEYAALYDDNGNSSQNLTTPYTNVLGGLGIFTGINSDTLTVTVTK